MELEDDADVAVEQDSEACWALWQEVADGMGLASGGVARQAGRPHEPRPQQRALTASAVLGLAMERRRICPTPGAWLQLHDILTLRGQRRLEPQPPPPLVGRAWMSASTSAKRARLHDFVLWARDYGGLRALHEFLLELDEEEWLHEAGEA